MRQKYYPLKLFLPLLIIIAACSSCGQDNPVREYEETVLPSSLDKPMAVQSDPHAFMGMPQGMGSGPMGEADPHAFMEDMPEGMQLPAGQDSPEVRQALAASVARPPLSWETPEGWEEKKGSSMRLATFNSLDASKAIECSIVSLGGQAGGLESNVVRWMNQINVVIPAKDELDKFLSRQEGIKTKGGFSITIIDLTEFSQAELGARATMQPFEEGKSPSMIAAIADLKDMVIFVKMTGSKESVIQNRDLFLSLCRSLVLNE